MRKVTKTLKKAVARAKKEVKSPIDETERLAIHDAFKRFDKNGDGHIDRSEVKEVMTTLIGRTPTEEQLGRILKKVDTNNDGVISLEEFEEMMVSRKKQTLALKKMFDQYDTNGDGRISFEELEEGLKKAGLPNLSDNELSSLRERMDKGKGQCAWFACLFE